MIQNVVLIGAGNVATQLGLAMTASKIQVRQVYSRSEQSAETLAEKLQAAHTTRLSEIQAGADLYLIAAKDSAIPEILENLSLENDPLIVHTAGSVPMSIFDGFTSNYGIFYPLQTFSKDRNIDFRNIPICIEASHPSNLVRLQKLAARLTNTIRQINSEERKTLHLAAVFVNNFVNHFYAIGAELIQEKKMSFDLLKPLIHETAAKIDQLAPRDAQTGPAKRSDQAVIDMQLKLLHEQPEFQKIYSFVTESIFQFHQRHQHDLL